MPKGIASLLICVAQLLAAQGSVAAPLRVLLLSGANNRDWRATTPVFEEIYS